MRPKSTTIVELTRTRRTGTKKHSNADIANVNGGVLRTKSGRKFAGQPQSTEATEEAPPDRREVAPGAVISISFESNWWIANSTGPLFSSLHQMSIERHRMTSA